MKKNTLKIIITTSIFAVSAFFIFSGVHEVVNAQADILEQTNAFAGQQGGDFGNARDPRLIAAFIIRFFLGLMGTLFTIYAIYGGFMIMTAAGSEEKMKSGTNAIKYAVIGIVVILSSWSITKIVSKIGRANELAEKDCVWVAEEGGWYIIGFSDVKEDESRFRRKTDPLAPKTIGKYVPCAPDE